MERRPVDRAHPLVVGSLERSAEAQAAYAVGDTELHSLITWTSSRRERSWRRG